MASHDAGRVLDDDCNVMMRFADGSRGVMIASQIAYGERNALSLEVYGDKGALHWSFENAEILRLVRGDQTVLLTPMSGNLLVRTPGLRGIGSGLIAPFATLYRDFAVACGGDLALIDTVLPGIEAGVRSMRFVERAVASNADGGRWMSLAL